MKINRIARNILSITAIAWSIPLAQAADVLDPETRRERTSAFSLNSLDVWVRPIDDEVKLTRYVRAARKR